MVDHGMVSNAAEARSLFVTNKSNNNALHSIGSNGAATNAAAGSGIGGSGNGGGIVKSALKRPREEAVGTLESGRCVIFWLIISVCFFIRQSGTILFSKYCTPCAHNST